MKADDFLLVGDIVRHTPSGHLGTVTQSSVFGFPGNVIVAFPKIQATRMVCKIDLEVAK